MDGAQSYRFEAMREVVLPPMLPPHAPAPGAGGAGGRTCRERRDRLTAALLRDPRSWVAGVVIGGLAAMALAPGLVGAGDPFACDLAQSLARPRAAHPLGFDVQGCDLWTLVVHGARSSLAIAGGAGLVTLVVGAGLGALAGWRGGWVDAVLGRIADVALAIPSFLVGLAVLALLDRRGVGLVILVLSLIGWPAVLRTTRAAVQQVVVAAHVEAARALGAGGWRLVTRHVLPLALWPALVQAATGLAAVVSAEATLSYLGVGLQLPDVSWGLLLAGSQNRISRAPHLLAPAAFLVMTVAAAVLLSEALRAAGDPRRR